MNQGVLLILLIMTINIVYVSLTTVRFILMIKGLKEYASILSMIEVFVYISGLTIILNNLNNYWNIAAYCIGFGIGVYLGSRIEERLALGYITAQVIIDSLDDTLPITLRKKGFGVTTWVGDGRDEKRLVMLVLTKRNRQKELLDIIDESTLNSFILFQEAKGFRGGFWEGRR
ncbi:hypothetical protein Desdi_0222 [Desulfitobacterium dichloroeliminans LMG P-21439]|uniref:UPF0316 protein Desdi_0222 n=1 Tax=Desulfitobacterium dichloroeliminans (strain LMG P-21439 / DCA1) TaxID=871963 RepID=L0F3L4_DESDL|nr:DUF2179 domain-containing protein [Desulfitobacterium dichloroeliminans]AGA67772.1 hypothetical protein Desdi_0222 [Desulfitobacterium dichloroeliminans LMG P-21439]